MKNKFICFEYKMNNGDVWMAEAVEFESEKEKLDIIEKLGGSLRFGNFMNIKALNNIVVLMISNISSIKIIEGEIDTELFKNILVK